METVLGLDEQQSEPSIETSEPNEKQPEPQVEKPEQSEQEGDDWNTDEILRKHFAQPVRFITYGGIKDLSLTRTKPYTIWGKDATNGERVKMAKLCILFAFPKEEMPNLKPHVKIRGPVKAQNLQPIKTVAERFHVKDELLEQAKANESAVTIVTRTGHVLNGRLQHFEKYVLYMQIGEKMVIVYRHGLHEFTVEE